LIQRKSEVICAESRRTDLGLPATRRGARSVGHPLRSLLFSAKVSANRRQTTSVLQQMPSDDTPQQAPNYPPSFWMPRGVRHSPSTRCTKTRLFRATKAEMLAAPSLLANCPMTPPTQADFTIVWRWRRLAWTGWPMCGRRGWAPKMLEEAAPRLLPQCPR